MIFLLLFVITITSACHPECHYQCDDPVCFAICEPVCEDPVCQYQCENNATCTGTPHCSVRCPEDMCESDQCPACETVCSPAAIGTDCFENVCSPLCEETTCSWKCRLPSNCPQPICELACDAPACEYTMGSLLKPSVTMIAILIAIVLAC